MSELNKPTHKRRTAHFYLCDLIEDQEQQHQVTSAIMLADAVQLNYIPDEPTSACAVCSAVDASRYTSLLHFAVARGKSMVVFALLQFGADPNIKDRHGATPLELAQERNDRKSINYLEQSIEKKNKKANK